MLAPLLHSPFSLAPSAADAVTRALAAAAIVAGVMAELPCRFHVLPSVGGQWIVVACAPAGDAAHAAFVHERSLTAVQRLTLSLWSEGVAAVWEPVPFATAPSETELRPEGLAGHSVLGRVWCPDPT